MMRTRSARKGSRASLRRKGLTPAAGAAGAEMPRCCTCGRPLSRLPAYLASAVAAGSAFQCEHCFYPGTGRGPAASTVVSSERTRWWADLVEEPAPREAPPEDRDEGSS